MKIGVVGAGLMGGEIALVFALGGFEVLLHDRDAAVLRRAIDRQTALLDKGVARGMYAASDKDEALARITPVAAIDQLSECDLVSEAVFEALDVKQAVLGALDAICKPGCILTSNTSTLPISTLSAALAPARRPAFVGAHFFSPVSRMALVEVISSFDTAPATSARVIEILQRIGKAPIVVKDVAGFAVNRLLHAMLIEAVKLVEEGVATPEDLDTACRLGLGHPIGPFALMDAVSSGLCLQVQQIMHDAYGERFRPPALLKQRVAAGFVGAGRRGWTRSSIEGAPKAEQ
ncbi:3-hydroxyacyl-CoA dehydrogenase family protein [Caulobacter sp.]|uniref:3-hydroxyacyl-CoA dehydrogenase family protein n=1 Tax=Caulobacter sp. TaxID=78 RepID=UPI002B48C6C3|nr:3-hydroxyacyl-CoA dehydrogenase family protein [Caulobacter sp.]HJV43215.1 3-hydroxyacyl-CoA dehydrogenase family protein [Caulobacter sp.]